MSARAFSGRRYWLIGASEGLGRALAFALSRAGAQLVLSARRVGPLEALAAALPGPAEVLPLDVTDAAAVEAAAQALGPVDGLVYLAALYWPMRAQSWESEKVRAMGAVNFTGALQAVGAVLPGMVARGAGHIVLTGSLAAYRGLPGAQGYGASKAGVMALAEGLYADLRGSGVDVQLASPGFIATRLTAQNDFAMPFLMTPEKAAGQMMALMRGRRFHRAFPWPFAALFRLGQFLPDALYYRLFAPRRG